MGERGEGMEWNGMGGVELMWWNVGSGLEWVDGRERRSEIWVWVGRGKFDWLGKIT